MSGALSSDSVSKCSTTKCKQPETGVPPLNFGQQIRQSRVAKGLSQKKLGELLGVSQKTISRYELGSCIPQDTVSAIADALGIPRVTIDDAVEPNRKGVGTHGAATTSKKRVRKECVRHEMDFAAFIKMLNGAAFSGYAVAREESGKLKFLMQDDSWEDELTPSLKRFNTALDVADVVKEYEGAVAFYAEFAFTPIRGSKYDWQESKNGKDGKGR